jgi:hypothetical protein
MRRYIEEQLFRARTADGVDDAIDALLDDKRYRRLLAEAKTGTVPLLQKILSGLHSDISSRFPEVFKIVGRESLERCDKMILASFKACLEMISFCVSQQLDAADDKQVVPTPRLTTLPSIFRRGMYGMDVACVCMFALRNAEEKSNMRNPPTVRRLVERLVESETAVLRWLSVVPGVKVPLDVLPENERVSLSEAFEDDMAVQAGYSAALENARRVNVYPFPPVNADD